MATDARCARYQYFFKRPTITSRVGAMLNNLQHAIILEHLTIEAEAADPNDAFLISMSIEGHADYLITGDRRAGLLQRKKINKTHVVTPAVFCSKVL